MSGQRFCGVAGWCGFFAAASLAVPVAAQTVPAKAAPAQGEAKAGKVLPPVVSANAKSLTQEVPAAAFKFEMVAIAGDASKGIKAYWIGKTELQWEAYDVFVYRLDEKPSEDAGNGAPAPNDRDEKKGETAREPAPKVDAASRPSKPYLPPDRGFGHEGYAAISITHQAATAFCRWLSERTGRVYRLASEAEWELACLAGSDEGYGAGVDAAKLGDFAWYEANADFSPHPVGKKAANAWGLHDMNGNIAEWVDAADGPVVKGGSYQDGPKAITARARVKQDASWNSSDPQVPKSKWWLADGPFVGFRVVCEMTDAEAKALLEGTPKTPTK